MTVAQNEVEVPVQRLASGADLPLPTYATAQAAGLDLLAAVDGHVVLAPGQRRLIPTGIALALPDGFEAQVRPRSGLALKHGLTIANSPGTHGGTKNIPSRSGMLSFQVSRTKESEASSSS